MYIAQPDHFPLGVELELIRLELSYDISEIRTCTIL